MYVFRRPHDYRAQAPSQRLVFAGLYAEAGGSASPTYRLPAKYITHQGVYRRSFTVTAQPAFRPPITQDPQGSTNLTFAASGTIDGLVSASSVVVAFNKTLTERRAWSRQRWDDTPIRAFNPIYTSWQPTGAALLSFAPSGTLLATVQCAGSTSLSFAAQGAPGFAGNLIGATSLSFTATVVTGGETLISGASSLAFTGTATPQYTAFMAASATLSFAVGNTSLISQISGNASLRFTQVGDAVLIFHQLETVPYLIGYTQAPAEVAIRSIHCVPNVIGTTGTVTAQDPAAFTLVERGSTITITLGGAINSVSSRKRRGQVPYNSIQ